MERGKPSNDTEPMYSEPTQPARGLDALKAEFTQPDAVECWSQFVQQQDECDRHRR